MNDESGVIAAAIEKGVLAVLDGIDIGEGDFFVLCGRLMEINFFLGFEDPKAGRLLMFCRLDVGVSATQIDHGAIVDDSLVVF